VIHDEFLVHNAVFVPPLDTLLLKELDDGMFTPP